MILNQIEGSAGVEEKLEAYKATVKSLAEVMTRRGTSGLSVEDAEAEGLVAAWRALRGYRGEPGGEGWYVSLAVRRAITRASRAARRRANAYPELAGESTDLDLAMTGAAQREWQAARKEDDRSEAVREAVAALPPLERQVAAMLSEEAESREIHKRLKISERTLKQVKNSLRKALRGQ